MSRELDEHREYLDDAARVNAFAQAIESVVRPGDVVVDLGCGTGILGLLACRAGASRVYAIDAGGMAEVAEAIAAANGYGDRVTVVRGHSLEVSLPERADVVVGDQIGRFGFDAGILEYFADARRRFLRPDGRFVPRCLSLWIAAVEHDRVAADTAFWSTRPAGFDMTAAQPIAWNSGYPRRVEAGHLLGPGIRAATITLGDDHDCVAFAVELTVERRGVLHGLAGWFTAQLDGTVLMTNAPGDPQRINRRNAILPIERPLAVAPGDCIRVQMHIRPADLLVKWVVEHQGDRFEHSTFSGMLLSRDALRKSRPQFVPHLAERGRARRLVLDLADGTATVADIERSLVAAHPGLFARPADACRFVAEVVTRDAE
jgi:SAM-dependent methyltransferase